jgi:hypothetical protein
LFFRGIKLVGASGSKERTAGSSLEFTLIKVRSCPARVKQHCWLQRRSAIPDRAISPNFFSSKIRSWLVGRALFRLFDGRSDCSDRWTWPDPIGTGHWGTETVCPWARRRPRPGIEVPAPKIEDQITSLRVPDHCGLKKGESHAHHGTMIACVPLAIVPSGPTQHSHGTPTTWPCSRACVTSCAIFQTISVVPRDPGVSICLLISVCILL